MASYGPKACQVNPNPLFHYGMVKSDECETYLLKHFTERYSACLHLINHPADLEGYADKVHKLVKTQEKPVAEIISDCQSKNFTDGN